MSDKKLIKGFWVAVYRNPRYDPCTNGGISSKFDDLFVVEEEGELSPSMKAEQLVKIIETVPGYKALVPFKKIHPDNTHCGEMAGGNFAMRSGSPDGKYNNFFFPVHDRYETWKQYEMFST